MNLRWRESVNYFRSYASLKSCVGEIRKRDRERERNKHYKPRMLMPFGINLIMQSQVKRTSQIQVKIVPLQMEPN